MSRISDRSFSNVSKMEKNVGTIDRMVRIVVGIVLLYVAYAGIIPGILRYVVGLLGVIMLAAAALSYCPLYPMLKINTAAKEK